MGYVSCKPYVRGERRIERGNRAMTRRERIETKLLAEFKPQSIAVVDDSRKHAGHAGAAPGGETHYEVAMESPLFMGLSRVARARAVHEALADEFKSGLHALSLKLRAPGE
jgi:BolA protein